MSSDGSPELSRNLCKKLLHCLTSSQMWLSPPVEDRQSTYLRKLKKKACFAFISLFYVAMWSVCFRSAVFLFGILCWTKSDVWETTELFLHLWGLSISAVWAACGKCFKSIWASRKVWKIGMRIMKLWIDLVLVFWFVEEDISVCATVLIVL